MLNNRNIIAAVIVALSIFGFFAFILPGYDGIMAARGILSDRKDKLAERTALVAQVVSLNDQYNQNVANIGKLDALLPTNTQPDQIVSSIQDIASQAGLILSEMSISNTSSQQADAPYKSGIITLHTVGQYEQFFSFMRLLEQSLRLYDIQGINISQGTGGGSAGNQLNFEIKINANSIK